jgi:hypothetical protein
MIKPAETMPAILMSQVMALYKRISPFEK